MLFHCWDNLFDKTTFVRRIHRIIDTSIDMTRFSPTIIALLLAAVQVTNALAESRTPSTRQLHLRKRHPATNNKGLQKNDHLKDFRGPQDVPIPPTDAPVVPTNAPVVAPTTTPSMSPTVARALETLSPTYRNLNCLTATSPPLGSSGNTILGRIGAGFFGTRCEFAFYPGSIGSTARYYEEIGPFFNDSPDPACVTVLVDPGTCLSSSQNVLVHVAAFESFNPTNIGETYLGDVGSTDFVFEFSFLAPGDSEFNIVGQQIYALDTAENGTGCVFSVTVEIGTGTCFTAQPTIEVTASPTIVPVTSSPTSEGYTPPPTSPPRLCEPVESKPLGSSGNTILGRIGAGFVGTRCGMSFYPGTIGDEPRYYEEIGPFFNSSPVDACFTVLVYRGTCVNSSQNMLVHVGAFTKFNSNDIGQGYLGDVGRTDDDFSFQFLVPGNSEFYIVGQQILDVSSPGNGRGCVFSVNVFGEQGCDRRLSMNESYGSS